MPGMWEKKLKHNKINAAVTLVMYLFVAIIIPTFVPPNCQTHHFLAKSASLGLTVAETSESLPLDGVPVQRRSSDSQTPEAMAFQK